MTLVVAGNSDGVYGRCDAKCHNATEPECHCICGGRFHGKGSGTAELRQAIEERTEEVLTALRAKGISFHLAEELSQRSLF